MRCRPIGINQKNILAIYINMFHTINPSIVRQINELQKVPEIKDKKLEQAEKKVIGEGMSELVDKLKNIRIKNPRKNIKITM